MKRLILCFITLVVIFFSCEKEAENSFFDAKITESSTREQDDQLLNKLYHEILDLSTQYDCSNAEEWDYTPIGAKACGGPAGYIAYSLKIDKGMFLNKVSHYTLQQERYNTKWGIISDCMALPPPNGIECINGKPELIYK